MKIKPRPGYERKSIARGSAWHWVKKKPVKAKAKKKRVQPTKRRLRGQDDHDYR